MSYICRHTYILVKEGCLRGSMYARSEIIDLLLKHNSGRFIIGFYIYDKLVKFIKRKIERNNERDGRQKLCLRSA